MEFLFDSLPVIFFFLSFKLFDIYIATYVLMIFTVLQIIRLYLKNKRIKMTQWIGTIFVLIFGSMTVIFQNKIFIQWKPSILYWMFSSILFFSTIFLKKNLIQLFMTKKISFLTKNNHLLWKELNWSCICFFLAMGFLNLYVVYNYNEDIWIMFKVFGSLVLLFIFMIMQSFWVYYRLHSKK